SSGRLVDDGPRAHTCPFALAVAPGREAPTTAAVLGDIVASRAADHV
ncbi:inositol monophosphatase, partial [Micrococcus luteus]|nr:inositol monophosphatase [Micrococcus luteus]